MSFQLTFLGYYSIKSPQLKKQTHSVKRRNWSHRERTAQADGPRWTAEADGFRWTAIADGPRRTGQLSASIGRPWRTAPAAGGRPWDHRTRPDAAVDVRTRDNPVYKSIHSPIASLSPLFHSHSDLWLCCYSGIARVLVVGGWKQLLGTNPFSFFPQFT
jgi:hypothetical protein